MDLLCARLSLLRRSPLTHPGYCGPRHKLAHPQVHRRGWLDRRAAQSLEAPHPLRPPNGVKAGRVVISSLSRSSALDLCTVQPQQHSNPCRHLEKSGQECPAGALLYHPPWSLPYIRPGVLPRVRPIGLNGWANRWAVGSRYPHRPTDRVLANPPSSPCSGVATSCRVENPARHRPEDASPASGPTREH